MPRDKMCIRDRNKIYVLDKKRGDIVALSDNLKEMEYVSKHGEAP